MVCVTSLRERAWSSLVASGSSRPLRRLAWDFFGYFGMFFYFIKLKDGRKIVEFMYALRLEFWSQVNAPFPCPHHPRRRRPRRRWGWLQKKASWFCRRNFCLGICQVVCFFTWITTNSIFLCPCLERSFFLPFYMHVPELNSHLWLATTIQCKPSERVFLIWATIATSRLYCISPFSKRDPLRHGVKKRSRSGRPLVIAIFWI